MLPNVFNHLWQSTAFALAAWLLAVAFRRNRARVRFAIWLGASAKFLVPFSVLIGVGGHLADSRVSARPVAPSQLSLAAIEISQPFVQSAPVEATSKGQRASGDWMALAVFVLWASGAAIIAVKRLREWIAVRAAVGASRLIASREGVEIRASPHMREPGVVGFLRPVLLLPAGIETRLTPAQLESVLAHELCHVRRRDNLSALLHMFVEDAFWFHPLVWWIGARLVAERERACDEGVLSAGNDPRVYASAIVSVCRAYTETPLACVAGVTGRDLKTRIEAIMHNRIGKRLSRGRQLLLAVTGLAAVAAPIVLGVIGVGEAPSLLAAVQVPAPPLQQPIPRFDVAVIKPCKPGQTARVPSAGRGGEGGPRQSNRLVLNCETPLAMVREAYLYFANGVIHPPLNLPPIEGAPAWADAEHYHLEAEIDSSEAPMPNSYMKQGPMLQTLLEQRFQLKLHRETREVPAYALTIAKGGVKMLPTVDGSCFDLSKHLPLPPPGERPFICGFTRNGPRTPGMAHWEGRGFTVSKLIDYLATGLHRPIVDRTGLTGTFDFKLEFAVEDSPQTDDPGAQDFTKTPADPAGASIFTAVQQQLGLTLETTRGPQPFLVIDHIERPTEN
jgi:uncharacterized protein (TIGR03435 family)